MTNLIKDFPVPLVLKKILKDCISGELNVGFGSISKKFYFSKGRLEFASTTLLNERFGETMKARGKITPEQHKLLGKIKDHSERKEGHILAEITALSRKDIYDGLVTQMKTIAVSTFGMTTGEWTFKSGKPVIPDNQSFKIRLEEILYKGIPKISDFNHYTKRFMPRAPVTTSIAEPLSKILPPDELRFYTKIKEYSNTSTQQIMAEMKAPEIFFQQKLVLLYLLNMLDFVEFVVDKQPAENIQKLRDIYGKIQAKELDYYQLLGLEGTESVEEMKQAYFDFSRQYHPDRLNVEPDSTLVIKANVVLAEINRAYDTLSNNDKKDAYDHGGYKEESGLIDRTELERRAKNLYLQANALYKKKHYSKALGMAQEVVKMEPNKASYLMLLGVCQAKLPAFKKQAEGNFRKVADMESWNADPLFALGELYRSEGLAKKAKRYFDMALELNMEHTLAGKAVEDFAAFMPQKKSIFSIFKKKK